MQQIGRYQILGELGRGAMGVVYRAQDPAIGRTIAIKSIRFSDLTDPSERDRLRERLLREAQSAGILSHPNIVTIYDILEENGMAYIFMELVNGPTLDHVLGEAPAPKRELIFSFLRQTASALDYAHRKGIVHRDIKPANIMIHDDGTAKITDFGVAKIASSQMTVSGTMMGTPSYMSPEQVQGGAIDGRADQFALGVIAYEILTGEKPFVAEYLPSLLYKICREDPASVMHLNPTLGLPVDAVLKRVLAKQPADRFATCTEFVKELEFALTTSTAWTPLVRGTSQDMPTLGTTSAANVRVPPPPPPAPPPQKPKPEPAKPKPQPAPPPPPPPPIVPKGHVMPTPSEAHTARNLILALIAVLILTTIVVVLQRPSVFWPQQAQQQPQPAPAVENNDQKPSPSPAPASQTPPPTPTVEPGSGETKPPETRPAEPSTPRRVTPPAADDVEVQVSTAPGGARILVDGTPVCTSPCSPVLARGRHVMTVSLDGYREARRIFEVPSESSLTVDLERMVGTLSVSTTPDGATILINGQPRPEKTPATFRLPAGRYRLQVVKDNLRTDEETIDITDSGISQRRYKLE